VSWYARLIARHQKYKGERTPRPSQVELLFRAPWIHFLWRSHAADSAVLTSVSLEPNAEADIVNLLLRHTETPTQPASPE
jgi:hypothetical protein